MSSYTPVSSIGWLDLDAAASERVGVLLRALDEPETLDALGLGSVRDAFSNRLSPGTSTVQTRLRYFVFLPWILQRLENQRITSAEFAGRLRNDEARLIDCLRHLGPNNGVIGYTAGRNLKRMPSEVYWGGLASWGLRQLDLSLAEYAQQAAALGRLRPDRDDDGNATCRSVPMWARLPTAPTDFLQADISFRLSHDEAEVLVDQIRQHHPGTLLAQMCGQPAATFEVEFPWELPTDTMPAPLAETLWHARCFSELTTGPQHIYNVLLARHAHTEFGWDTSDLEERQLSILDEWAELVGDRYDELRAWVDELSEFWALLAGDGIHPKTQEFVTKMVTRALADPAGMVDDPIVKGQLRDREILLKSRRARLAHRSALENWNQTPFGGQLDYRWRVTRSYLVDLADGLQVRH